MNKASSIKGGVSDILAILKQTIKILDNQFIDSIDNIIVTTEDIVNRIDIVTKEILIEISKASSTILRNIMVKYYESQNIKYMEQASLFSRNRKNAGEKRKKDLKEQKMKKRNFIIVK